VETPTQLGNGDETPPGRYPLLKHRDFAIYWWSGIASGTGTWLHNVTASILMLTMTGSPFMVGVVNIAIFIPTLLFGLHAGSLGDRFDRRWIVAISQSAACVVAALLTVLSIADQLTPWLLVLACFLIGTASSISKPAISAMIPALVPRPDIARATALNVMQFQFGQIAGPALASLILVVASPAWAFGMNAVSFVVPIIAMRLIRLGGLPGVTPVPKRSREPSGLDVAQAAAPRRKSPIADGLRFIRSISTMPAILATVVLSNGAGEALRTLAPTLAAELDFPEAAGFVLMGYSVGAFVGLIFFGRIEAVLPQRWTLVTAFGLQAVGLSCVALAPNLPLTVLGAAPIGVAFSLSTPLLSASLQHLTPDAFRSRVMSVFSMAHLGLRPLFSLVAGGLAVVVDMPFVLASFAVLAAIAAVFVHRHRVAGA
jgi:MFS family permease